MAHSIRDDFEPTRPLYDALENGFTSMGISITISDNVLLVGDGEMSFKDAYLDPLKALLDQRDGSIFTTIFHHQQQQQHQPITLVLDMMEQDNLLIYSELNTLLRQYPDMITHQPSSREPIVEGQVTIVLQNVYEGVVFLQADRWFWLEKLLHTDSAPFNINTGDCLNNRIRWIGLGWELLASPWQSDIIQQARDCHKLVRVTGDAPADTWDRLLSLDVDRISVAQVLSEFNTYLQGQYPTALSQAHGHNDYERANPLFDALDNGFTSLEADIFWILGSIVVSHNYPFLWQGRRKTLRELYLEPLAQLLSNESNLYFSASNPLELLIDFKQPGMLIYNALVRELKRYPDMITHVDGNGTLVEGPVKVVLSGFRPRSNRIPTDSDRWVWLDGRIQTIESDCVDDNVAWISDNWNNLFDWIGANGTTISLSEYEALIAYVEAVHSCGKQLRFWATPESTDVWNVLWEAGVDMINTDEYPRLAEFLFNKYQEEYFTFP